MADIELDRVDPYALVEETAEVVTVTDDVTEAVEELAELPADQLEVTEAEHPEGWNPDGPGNVQVPLKHLREQNKALQAEAEQARAEAADLRQRQAQFDAQQRQAQQQQQAAQSREELVEQLNWVDGTEAVAIVERIRQYDAQVFQQQAQGQRLSMSAEMAREMLPDFDTHLSRAYEQFGPALDAIALQKNPSNPAKWAYDLGKSLGDVANVETRIAEGIAKALPAALKAALQKQQPPTTQGHKGIAHVSAESPGGGDTLPLHKRSQEDIRREAYGIN